LTSAKNKLVFALIAALAALGIVVPATAGAAVGHKQEGEPKIDLVKQQPKQALIGTEQEVTLVASNPIGEKRGYNLSFRDVLPKGVEYAGGAAVAPIIIGDPKKGPTTLIFENVGDLSGNSSYSLGFKVKPLPEFFAIAKEHEYTDEAEAFVTRRARLKPTFNAKGEVEPESWKGRATNEASTELTAVEIKKSEKSPEGEIPRGIHDHQRTYTLTIQNNKIGETSNLEVEDLIPAGLEFLGCGKTDNTTEAKTNPGSKEEYPGSGPIDPGNAPTGKEEATKCPLHEAYWVGTVVNPAGHPAGVYTQVKWKNLGSLPANGKLELQYVVGIPILKNTAWPAGTEPDPESLLQIANLDNNPKASEEPENGGETVDEEALTNFAEVKGTYEGVPVKDEDEMTRTAEDLAIQKTVDPGTIEEKQKSIWTLDLETSEYRFVNDVSIEDLLPNGLCPVGKKGYEKPDGTAVPKTEECELEAGIEPTWEIVGTSLKPEPAEYTSIKNLENGTFELLWNKTSVAPLGQLAPNEHLVLKFPTKTRTFYEENYAPGKPVLTRDSWTNHVKTEGPDFAICAPGEKICTDPLRKIFTEETEGTPDKDVSEASQEAGGVTIEKTVRENDGTLVPADCSGTYVPGKVKPLPSYAPGDEICWNLRVDFAQKLYAGEPIVTDFVPGDEEYVEGSAFAVEPPAGENSIEATFEETFEGEKENLRWTLGTSVKSEKQVFQWRFRTRVKKEKNTQPEQITGNLMKFQYANSFGTTFPLRDRAEVERKEPKLTLAKSITEVGEKSVINPPPTVNGGEVVSYKLDVENEGNLDAQEAEIWDELPAKIDCTMVTLPAQTAPQNAVCQEGFIKWTGVAVAEEGLTTLTYKVQVPIDIEPGHVFINKAAVNRYKSLTNVEDPETGKPKTFEYRTEEGLNPAITEPNTEKIRSQAEFLTTAASLTKEAATETTFPGNSAKNATIGEKVTYTVTAKIPKNSKIYGLPVLEDEMPEALEFVSRAATLDGSPLAEGPTLEGLTFEATPRGAKVKFNGAYPATPSATEHVVVLTLVGRVRNIPANFQGVEIPNTASFKFSDSEGAPVAPLEKSTKTPVVEPHLVLRKNLLPGGRSTKVEVNEPIEYSTEVENIGGSAAHEVAVLDTVPPGMVIVNPGTGTPVEGGSKIGWSIEEIASGTKQTLTYTLKVKEPATVASVFNNKVEALTQSLPKEGGVLPPQTRTAATPGAAEAGYKGQAENTVSLIGATVSKQVSATEATIGGPLTYTLDMVLPPGIEYFNTTVVDTLPAGVEFDELVSAKCVAGCEAEPAVEGKPLTPTDQGGLEYLGWYFGKEFKAGPARKLEVVFKAHVRSTNRPAPGGAEVKDGNEEVNKLIGLYNNSEKGEPTATPIPGPADGFTEKTNEDSKKTTVKEPKLALTKAVAATPALIGPEKIVRPGSTLEYTLTVTNNGDAPAYDFEVKDKYSSKLTGIAGGAIEGEGEAKLEATSPELVWKAKGPLGAGKSLTLHYTAKLVESSKLTNLEAITNAAAIPTFFGLPEAERTPTNEYRTYPGPTANAAVKAELPQITLKKTTGVEGEAEGAPANRGAAFPWKVVVKNTAVNAGAKELVVQDELPSGWTYKEGSAKLGEATLATTVDPGNPRLLTWTVPKLTGTSTPAEAEAVITFQAIPGISAVLGENVNKASVTGKDEGGEPTNTASGQAKATVTAPKFKVEKTPDGEKAVAGTEVTYQVKVTNEGTGDATAFEVSDELRAEQEYAGPGTLPPGVKQLSPNPPPGVGPALITFEVESLKAGASVVIPIPVKVPAADDVGSPIENHATVISPQTTEVTPDDGHWVIAREADLAISKSAVSVEAGEPIVYTLTATNNGPSNASAVEIKDEVPVGTTFIKAGPKAGSSTTGSCTEAGGFVTCLVVGEIEPGKSVEFEAEFFVETGREAELENEASVKGAEPDPIPGNDTTKLKTPIGGLADVSIVKTGPSLPVLLGGTFTYKLEVANAGPSNANEVEVLDELPEELEFVEAKAPTGVTCEELAGTVACELGTLLPNQPVVLIEVTVKAIALPPAGKKAVNTAEVTTSTIDPKTENNESTAETEILPSADLVLTKTAPLTVEPDGTLEYTLHVDNKGPSVAHKVKVSDPLPTGVEFVSADTGCAAAGTTVTCELAELAVGASVDFHVTVHVPFALGGTALTNTASVGAEEGDLEPGNNTSTVKTNVGPAADLAITKTMGKAEAGKPLTYTLAVTNKGPSASSAVTVKDTLPAGITFKSATPSQGTCSASGQTVTCALGQLASGGSAQVSIEVDVAATVTGSIRNVASVEGPEPDPDKSNNESAVEGPVTPVPPVPPVATGTPNLKVVKTADTSSPQVGAPFTYHVEVSNMGGAEAKNVKVVDTLDGPVKVTSIDTEAGTKCSASGSTITCNIAGVPVGKTVNITYDVVAEAAGPLKNTVSAMAANGEKAPANNRAVKGVNAKAAKAKYTLSKTASKKVVEGGRTVGFTITLHNGFAAMINAKICDRLPAALTFVKAPGARYVDGEACWTKKYVAAHKTLKLHLVARAVKSFKPRKVRNVATSAADNAGNRSASAAVRIKAAFAGKPGGVTG
jgi:large repetitive protein